MLNNSRRQTSPYRRFSPSKHWASTLLNIFLADFKSEDLIAVGRRLGRWTGAIRARNLYLVTSMRRFAKTVSLCLSWTWFVSIVPATLATKDWRRLFSASRNLPCVVSFYFEDGMFALFDFGELAWQRIRFGQFAWFIDWLVVSALTPTLSDQEFMNSEKKKQLIKTWIF